MAPREYEAVRQQWKVFHEQRKESSADGLNVKEPTVLVHNRPYLPHLTVDASKDDDIRMCVSQLLQLPTTEKERSAMGITNAKDFQLQTISGGITNRLVRVSGIITKTPSSQTVSTDIPDSCLVRVFGAEGMIDRDVENATFAALAQQGLAPQYYGRFANGRIEGWCDDMRALTVDELPNYMPPIARAVAQLHTKFVIPKELESSHPLDKPSLWTQLHDWCNQAIQYCQNNDPKAKPINVQRLGVDVNSMPKELEWLQTTVVPSNAKVAFCHNDILAANVLVQTNNDNNDNNHNTIQLIDFEYGGVNFVAFDIANHFNEFAGGPPFDSVPNYNHFPSREQQLDFVKAYVQERRVIRPSQMDTSIDEEVQELYQHVQAFVLCNHLYWGLWAVNQAATEGNDDYDYELYAHHRLQQYYVCKKEQYP